MAQNRGGVWTWIHSDHLHSATVITDEDGNEVRRLAYTAFGEEALNTGTGEQPPYTYTGKELDSTGLMYYGARYYDPVLCRFVTPDTVYDQGTQGLNRYSYALNNPIVYHDPTGNGAVSNLLDFLRGWGDYNIGPRTTPNLTFELANGTVSAAAAGVEAIQNSSAGQFIGDMGHDMNPLNINDPRHATQAYTDAAAASSNPLAKSAYYGLAATAELGPDVLMLVGTALNSVKGYQAAKTTLQVANTVTDPAGELTGQIAGEMLNSSLGVAEEALNGLKKPATVDELLEMMNKRPGVNAQYAAGEAEDYLKAIQAEGSHILLEGNQSDILLRKDVASRRTAFHEWLHRYFQGKAGQYTPNEDKMIEDFLSRHEELLKLNE